jgi:hypothetical protein
LVLSPTKKCLCYCDNFLRVAGITNTKITYSMLVLSPTKKCLCYCDNFLRVASITNTKITTLCWCYHQQKNAYVTITIFSELLASPTQKSLLYVGVITNKKTLMLLSQFSPSCWHHQHKNHLGNYLQQATLILFLLPQNTCIMFQRS